MGEGGSEAELGLRLELQTFRKTFILNIGSLITLNAIPQLQALSVPNYCFKTYQITPLLLFKTNLLYILLITYQKSDNR